MIPHYDFKIVVAGPFASGKTSMIEASSDVPLVGTEAPTSGDEGLVKESTTVGMEYGSLRHESDLLTVALNLYGVPGQERFNFMWDVVGLGMDGLFLLVDAERPDTWPTSAKIATHFLRNGEIPTVVGVNRATDSPEIVAAVQREVPVPGAAYLGFDVVNPEAAQDALVELLLVILDAETAAEAQGSVA